MDKTDAHACQRPPQLPDDTAPHSFAPPTTHCRDCCLTELVAVSFLNHTRFQHGKSIAWPACRMQRTFSLFALAALVARFRLLGHARPTSAIKHASPSPCLRFLLRTVCFLSVDSRLPLPWRALPLPWPATCERAPVVTFAFVFRVADVPHCLCRPNAAHPTIFRFHSRPLTNACPPRFNAFLICHDCLQSYKSLAKSRRRDAQTFVEENLFSAFDATGKMVQIRHRKPPHRTTLESKQIETDVMPEDPLDVRLRENNGRSAQGLHRST